MSQLEKNRVVKPAPKADELETLLIGILAIGLVLVATGIIYFLVATNFPWDHNMKSPGGVDLGLWIGGILGTMFFVWGVVGVLSGKIVIGWGTYNQVRTTITGAGAFVASISTALGGLLFLSIAVISLLPEVGYIIHPTAAMLSGFVTIFVGWICALIVRALGY